MGANLVYRDKPITKKHTTEGAQKPLFKYAQSDMQGWRHSMEDAHICNPIMDKETGAALFAVFDGHGGREVAIFCE
jgi:protein phosphatase 1G